MNENIHSNDDLFRKAYQNFGEDPSPEVWDKLSAQLDKKDAIHYRMRFAWWRNVAVLLLLMLGAAGAYELFVDNTANSNANTATKNIQTKQSTGTGTDQQINPPGSDNIKNNVTENDKPAKQGNGQKLNKIIETKQPFNIQKLIPVTNANAKADVAANDVAFYPKENSSWKKAGDATNDIDKAAVDEKDNTITNESSQHAFAELKAVNLSKQPGISVNEKTIKLSGLSRHYWTFSPYIAIGFTGNHLDNDDAFRTPNEPDERDKIYERENHEFSYSLGLFARYHFNNHFNIKTGLSYSDITISILPQTLHTSSANDHPGYKFVTSAGYAYLPKAFGATPSAGDSIYAENSEHHSGYLDIPLMAAYTINPASRLTIRPGAGIATHVFLWSKAETEIKKDDKTEYVSLTNFKGQSPLYFSFIADAELHYRFNKKLSLIVLPSFNYGISSITNKNVVKTYPYSITFSGGLTWNLGL